MLKRKWLFLSMFIFSMGLIGTQINAETVDRLATEVKGEVVDAVTGESLEEVELTLVELEKTAETDSDGEFTFGELEPGFYTLSIIEDGYEEFSQTIEVTAAETTEEGIDSEIAGTEAEGQGQDAIELDIELQPLE